MDSTEPPAHRTERRGVRNELVDASHCRASPAWVACFHARYAGLGYRSCDKYQSRKRGAWSAPCDARAPMEGGGAPQGQAAAAPAASDGAHDPERSQGASARDSRDVHAGAPPHAGPDAGHGDSASRATASAGAAAQPPSTATASQRSAGGAGGQAAKAMDATLYAVLGVAVGAAPSEIKAAYRRVALSAHPDKVRRDGDSAAALAEAELRMAEVNNAFKVLSDPTARAHYDRVLANGALASEFDAAGGGAAADSALGGDAGGLVKVVCSAEASIDEMDWDDGAEEYSFGCRCGGTYRITEGELDEGVRVVSCESCSLRLRVLDCD